MSRFKYYHRKFYFQEDLEDDFPVVPNPTPFKRVMPNGVYHFRGETRRAYTEYYVCNNTWYLVHKGEVSNHALHLWDYGLIPCKKESEWIILASKSVFPHLSPLWKKYVAAWHFNRQLRKMRTDMAFAHNMGRKKRK